MIKKIIYKTVNTIYRVFNKIILVQGIKETFACYGKNVSLSYDIDVRGNENIHMGSNVQIGPHAVLWTTRAKIIFEAVLKTFAGIQYESMPANIEE